MKKNKIEELDLFPSPRLFHPADFKGNFPRGPQVCGLDEAGRGPLAGPVYAAAVVLPDSFPFEILNDSKALSAKKREAAAPVIMEKSLAWAIDFSGFSEIDELNILEASLLAMRRAYARLLLKLERRPDYIYVDGNRDPRFDTDGSVQVGLVVKGDACVPAIMAASILAKVARDRMMERYDWLYPEYGYAKHKGYPTAEHRAVCAELGPSPIQRMSFACKYGDKLKRD